MRKILFIFLFLAIPVFVSAGWKAYVKVDCEVNTTRNLPALRDSIYTSASTMLDNVKCTVVAVSPALLEVYDIDIQVEGDKKAETDLDDFGTTITTYLQSRFTNAEVTIHYDNKVIW